MIGTLLLPATSTNLLEITSLENIENSTSAALTPVLDSSIALAKVSPLISESVKALIFPFNTLASRISICSSKVALGSNLQGSKISKSGMYFKILSMELWKAETLGPSWVSAPLIEMIECFLKSGLNFAKNSWI
ncbi:hypothetical protein WICPIJ_003760 [Wickerhamomyces pijperi]|uniref:Uncharacterized protein n=1 Tax=Wickerhamomyces pijperi TaxID=599730 RepID=A0A9P8Q7A5_WICPI|nr:hypothetical protein WICPIJ_003760 [Wickerhamomyces pijperi]